MRLPNHLPALTGATSTGYRILGGLLILLSLLAGTAGTYRVDTRITRAAEAYLVTGVRLGPSGADSVAVIPYSREAHAQGLKSGRLIAIDGVPLGRRGPIDDAVVRALRGPEGSTIVLRVAGESGGMRDVRLTRAAAHLRDADAGTGLSFATRQAIRMLLEISASLIVTLAILLLYLRRPHDPVAALLVIGGTALSLAQAPAMLPGLPGWITPVMLIFGPLGLYGGMILFPSASLRPRWILLALVLVVVVILVLVSAAFAHIPDLPLFGVPLMALTTLVVIVAQFRASPPGIERQQIKWAMLGMAGLALFSIVASALALVSDGMTDEALRPWIVLATTLTDNLAEIALAGGLLVALLRYRLYDAEAAISRSAVLAALTLALLGIFAGSEKVIELLGERYFGEQLGALAGGLAAAFAAVTIAPLHHRLTHWAENRFQKQLIRVRRDLPALMADLRETATSRELAAAALDRVASVFRAGDGVILLGDSPAALRGIAPENFAAWQAAWIPAAGDELICDPADPLLPVRLPLAADGCGRVGWLLLGPRPDGSLYGKDERELLAELADPVARALAITARREADARAAQAVVERLDQRMAALEAAVARLAEGAIASSA